MGRSRIFGRGFDVIQGALMGRWTKFRKRLGGAVKATLSITPVVLAARSKPKNLVRGVRALGALQETVVRRTARGDFKGAVQVGLSRSALAIRANAQSLLPGTAIERKITKVEKDLNSSDPAVVADAQRRSAKIDRIAMGAGIGVVSVLTAGTTTGALLAAVQSVAGAAKQEREIKRAEKAEDISDAEEKAEIRALERQLLDAQMGLAKRKYEPNILDAATDTYRGEAA